MNISELNANQPIDVTAINPIGGLEWTFRSTRVSSLRLGIDGQIYYARNPKSKLWKVVNVQNVEQSEIDSASHYFEQYGTACE